MLYLDSVISGWVIEQLLSAPTLPGWVLSDLLKQAFMRDEHDPGFVFTGKHCQDGNGMRNRPEQCVQRRLFS